jgi:hypothetical protein
MNNSEMNAHCFFKNAQIKIQIMVDPAGLEPATNRL